MKKPSIYLVNSYMFVYNILILPIGLPIGLPIELPIGMPIGSYWLLLGSAAEANPVNLVEQ